MFAGHLRLNKTLSQLFCTSNDGFNKPLSRPTFFMWHNQDVFRNFLWIKNSFLVSKHVPKQKASHLPNWAFFHGAIFSAIGQYLPWFCSTQLHPGRRSTTWGFTKARQERHWSQPRGPLKSLQCVELQQKHLSELSVLTTRPLLKF